MNDARGWSKSHTAVRQVGREAYRREQHGRHAPRLSQFTVAYNVLEGIVSIVFAVLSGSSALLGFGVDSFVESHSGAVVIWRFTASCLSAEQIEWREHAAARLVGIAVLILVAYIGYLWYREKPDASPAGIAIAVASLLVMPTLFVLKRSHKYPCLQFSRAGSAPAVRLGGRAGYVRI